MKRLSVTILVVILSAPVFSQNSFINDSSNGSGIGLELGYSGQDKIRLLSHAAFSISGVLDIGLGFGNYYDERYGSETTDTAIGLIYNIIPARYSFYIFTVMANIRGTYDYIISDSEYIDSIDGTMEGQGYTLAVEGLIDVTPIEFITLRAGYRGQYSSRLFITEGTAVSRRERERSSEKGFIIGARVTFPGLPILGYEMLFMDSTVSSQYMAHRITLVFKSE